MQLKNNGIPLVGPLLNKIVGSRNDRFVKRYTSRVAEINALEPSLRPLTDTELKGKTEELQNRITAGEKADAIMVEAFAVAREAMDRAVGIRNIFNPAHSFDPSRLPEPEQRLYEETQAKIDAMESLVPLTALQMTQDQEENRRRFEAAKQADSVLGSTFPIEPWRLVEIPVALYEAVRELYPVSRPPFRARPFDVQLIGGMVLYGGKIAEMKTGEGKTIVAPLATYLATLEGLKVHVVTVNDYLVQRDRDWTAPFFNALGLTVGAIHPQHSQPEHLKREMYRCDIVYGTTSEFGFDYLRDNMKRSADQQVQRLREFAIVDEVDSTLIDEARTPLIISGEAHDDAPRYDLADQLARHLKDQQKPWQTADDKVKRHIERIKGLEGDIRNTREKDKLPELNRQLEEAKTELPRLEVDRDQHTQYYEVELDRKQCFLSHEGVAEAQRAAGIGSFYVGDNVDIPHLLEQALRAYAVYERDKDYIVMPSDNPQTGQREESVVIVDTFTGRPMIGRQWSDGLHQAVECKERVPIKQETQTVATITIQNFFKMYKRLAGMTGTADTEAQEFHDIYELDVVSIPTNRPVIRRDFDDLMFLTEKDKWTFIVDEIKAFHDVGRPVLVGTTSVERSETLSKMLTKAHGVQHDVLNAKQHEREANLIEGAGSLGAVMIATNMAGRGTDIRLEPIDRERLLDHWLRRGICSRELTVDATTEDLRLNVYRKIAPRELELSKREVEDMPFEELEITLLRHWALHNTMLSEKKIASLSAEPLREALDETGRILLHRIDWFESMEQMGGLHVVGTERHESRRIDNQLRGRCGRQGDRGSSRFFVSCEDDLMKMFAGETMLKLLPRLGFKEGDSIESSMLSKRIEGAQRKVEERNFYSRKNLLEMDEVMEHQRQSFYGMRQRVIDGRDVKGLLFDFITDSVADACAKYLAKSYPAECAAEAANNLLEAQIVPERLKGRELEEMLERIRADAKADARSAITITLGEYLPDDTSEVEMDFDAGGLSAWAKAQYNVEFDPEKLRGLDRSEIASRLGDAADEQIDAADLSGIERFTVEHYGTEQLIEWCDKKFGIPLTVEEVETAKNDGGDAAVEALVVQRADELYEKREIDYPVEFAMEMAMAMMRQSPQQAQDQLIRWANQRYDLGWTVEALRAGPKDTLERLRNASEEAVKSGKLTAAIEEAASVAQDDAKLGTFFKERLGMDAVPFEITRLSGDDREHAVRSNVETVLRYELLMLDRTLLLNTFDTSWKEHLYNVDQLRGSIGFRSFAQQDYRIEFKREGSRLFGEMEETVRDRVTDHVFKMKLSPRVNPPAGAPAQRAAPAAQQVTQTPGTSADMYPAPGDPKPAPARNGNGTRQPAAVAATGAAGPGISAPPAPSHDTQQVSNTMSRAGDAPAATQAEAPASPTPKPKRVGRNDPCPCGSGKKHKKCCGA